MLLFGLVAIRCNATDLRQEYTKTINKEFVVSADATVELSNRYGKINIETWERNAVKLDIRIVVQTNSQENANEVFDRINIDLYNSASVVRATTEIDSKGGRSWWDRIFGENSRDKFKIYYDVKMPRSGALEATAKYCDVKAIGTIAGETKLDVKYGDIDFENIENDVEIELAYGDAAIKSVRELDLSLRYGEIDVETASDVSLNTRYSKVRIDALQNARIDTRYDDFVLGEVNELNIETGYSDFRVKSANVVTMDGNYSDLRLDELSKEVTTDMSYGDLSIGKLMPGFSRVQLEGRYSDFVIGLSDEVQFSLDIEARYAGVSYPKDRMEINYLVEQGNSKTIRGKTKNGGGGTIEAEIGYGSIKLYD